MTTRPPQPAVGEGPPAGDVVVHLLPAIARQATASVSDPATTHLTARVVAGALGLLGRPAHIVAVGVDAYPSGAWDTGAPALRSAGGPGGAAYFAVETGDVLIDACLDLLAVPSAGVGLRPSWFSLAGSWWPAGTAAFRDARGAVVRYRRLPGVAAVADVLPPDGEPLALRLAAAVADLCRQSAAALSGVERSPRRWMPVVEAA